jgi:hypothetical protein
VHKIKYLEKKTLPKKLEKKPNIQNLDIDKTAGALLEQCPLQRSEFQLSFWIIVIKLVSFIIA